MMHAPLSAAVLTACSTIAGAAPLLELSATSSHAHEPLILRVRTVDSQGMSHAAPWPESQDIAWLFVRVSGTQENRDTATLGAIDADGARRVMPGAPGIALVGCDLHPSSESWTAEQANEFGRLCGEEALCFKDSVSVRHSISTASIVRVAPAPQDLEHPQSNYAAMSKAGMASEIRPLMDPIAIEGGDLAFRVYVGGEAVPRAAVRAVHVESGAVQSVRADAKGIGVVRVDLPGPWRLEFHTISAITDSMPEMWQATSCSLTFTAKGNQTNSASVNPEVKL